jgi:DNA sulfur modification protein DndD
MQLRTLTLTNFGTYGGEQSIDLRTSGTRNIVLFGGKNGSGKSTLLEAIRLCFYGHLSDRSLFSRDKYEQYLEERIHRDPHNIIQPRFAAVGLEFEYGEQDAMHVFQATRSWERRNGSKISEAFELAKDGRPVTDVSTEHWQDFVRDLIPTGVSDLFFFDGERIQHLADGAQDQETLSDAVKNLLGADLIERLHADLGIYRSNLVRAQSNASDSSALEAMEERISEVTQQLSSLQQEAARLDQAVLDMQEQVTHTESELAAWGGTLSKDKQRLQEERVGIRTRKELLEGQVRDYAQGLLPISLALNLADNLVRQIESEESAQANKLAQEVLNKSSRQFLRELRSLPANDRTKTPLGQTELYKKIEAVAKKSLRVKEIACEQIHSISRDEGAQIKNWVKQATNEVPAALKRLSSELEDLYRREQAIERDLSRVPSEELVRPLLEKVSVCYKNLANANSASAAKHEEVAKVQKQLDDLLIASRKLTEKLSGGVLKRESMERAARIQDALNEYKQVLIGKKIDDLQKAASEYFNLLSRKRKLHRRVSIHPITFEVTILDNQDHMIRKQELSAGEKQIYAVSMLWALAKVSGRPLPMIIDTPLARLDRDHRTLLSQHYFPKASHQVLILSTDTEIDEQHFSMLQPAIARSYELAFLPEHNRTEIRPGYFGGQNA